MQVHPLINLGNNLRWTSIIIIVILGQLSRAVIEGEQQLIVLHVINVSNPKHLYFPFLF